MMGTSLAPPLVRSRTLSSPSLVDDSIKSRKPANTQSPFATVSRAFKWSAGSLSRKGGPKGMKKQIRTVASCNNLLNQVLLTEKVDLSPITECFASEPTLQDRLFDSDVGCENARPWPKGHIYCFTRGSRIKRSSIKQPESAKKKDKRSLLTKLATYVIPDWERPGHEHGVTYPRHAFANESPYPLIYSSEALASDRDALKLMTAVANGHPSFYKFPTPPRRVLDLGCGDGSWIIQTSELWKHTQFIGFDMAPLERSNYDSRRIIFEHGNFLNGLPFKKQSFDYIRLSRASMGIPCWLWETVLIEVHRVLTSDGLFEVIEDGLLPEVECFCDQCVNGSSTKLDRVFRQVIQDNHLGEAERILPFYQNVLFEGLATGYYELGLPVDELYVLPPESAPTLGGATRSRSSSASSSTIISDASSVDTVVEDPLLAARCLTSKCEAVTFTPTDLNNATKVHGLVRMSDRTLLQMTADDVSKAAAYPYDLVHFAAPAVYAAIEASIPGANSLKLGQIFDWAMWDHWRTRYERLSLPDPYRCSIASMFEDEEDEVPSIPKPRSKLFKAGRNRAYSGPHRYAFRGDVREVVRKFSVWHFYNPMLHTPGRDGGAGKYVFHSSVL